MDPMTGRVGLATVRDDQAVRLQLQPGETIFVRAYDAAISGKDWPYEEYAGEPTPIDGQWRIEFLAGGPQLPGARTTRELTSWTSLSPPDTERFAGTAAYTIRFARLQVEAARHLLDLGRVQDSARIFLNGEQIATLLSPPYRVAVGPLRPQANELRVEVTNVAANRIRDLDRRAVRWRMFRDINFVNIDYQPFDASHWQVREAGLLGPVTMRPLR
jgi:hypothetical protein